jgi:superfamily II DNA or RNA helicase
MNNKWFESRGLRVLDYQSDSITKVQDSLIVNEKTVLAACPSAGKTLMTIYIIEEYLREHPDHKIIVLAHGTTILRTQFHDVLVDNKPYFTYSLIQSGDDYLKSTSSVIVCLPQTLKNVKLRKANLLIVDEAHHFYVSTSAKMIKDIIKETEVTKQLLLTGTPSKFIYENLRLNRQEYYIIPVTLNTIFDAGMVSEAYVEVASSTYNFSLEDYNVDDELKTTVHIKSSDTNKTLDDLLEKIVHRLRSFRGNVYANITPDWKILLGSLKKTMVACRSIQQAEQVKKYLDKKGIDSALSTSENDTDSLEIKRFKDEDKCLVLIVVYRGVLGFNFEKLVNVVDMTTSHNVDRIYQLFSRVIRVDRDNTDQKKLFFKVAPNMLTDYYKHIMSAVLMLSDDEFFTKFNGRNFYDMVIPVKKVYDTTPNPDKPETLTNPNKTRKYQPIDMEGLPVFEFFKNLLHKKDGLLTTYCMTTVRDVRAEFMNRMPPNYWTFENCLESALKYTTRGNWQLNETTPYNVALNNGWLEDCCKHMDIIRIIWTKEMCLESAKKYNKKIEWQTNKPNAYGAAKNNGWLNECYSHIEILFEWTKEMCLESAKKYDRSSDWRLNDSGAYCAAVKKGWLNECCSHMSIKNRISKIKWSKEMCLEKALKYNNTTDWRKFDSKSFNFAVKNGWFDDCSKHMKIVSHKGNNYWSKEMCIESANKYPNLGKWKIDEPSAYGIACSNGWLDDCKKEMVSLNKPKGYWTFEKCMESASKYDNIRDWSTNDGSAYSTAKINGWLDDCKKHMVILVPMRFWTIEKCIESASKYDNISEWKKYDGKAYGAARNHDKQNGNTEWYDKCKLQMKKYK